MDVTDSGLCSVTDFDVVEPPGSHTRKLVCVYCIRSVLLYVSYVFQWSRKLLPQVTQSCCRWFLREGTSKDIQAELVAFQNYYRNLKR